MAINNRKNIFVYADWMGLQATQFMGMLSSDVVRGTEIFSFSYEPKWVEDSNRYQLDPDLQLYKGPQYVKSEKLNFGVFLDSCPDRWGRVLMDRREAQIARQENRDAKVLRESDYLLGVYDGHRMGGLRFKLDPYGEFLNDNKAQGTPPWTSLRELEHASLKLEEDGIESSPEYLKWLNMLISPGSSLGGARPKASVLDEAGNLWIAKFPSQKDDINVGAWEMLAYQVAKDAGLRMDECKAQAFNSSQHTFMAKRFDRKGSERIHFASALTCLGKVDGEDGDKGVSYIHLAEFLAFNGSDTNRDLEELWRRIILNICISNVDDHLRNHGFLLNSDGWSLSPAYDINPLRDGDGLKLNISETDNAQDLNLALSVIGYFRIDLVKAKNIISEVKKAVAQWRRLAKELSISKTEQDRMERAFRLAK